MSLVGFHSALNSLDQNCVHRRCSAGNAFWCRLFRAKENVSADCQCRSLPLGELTALPKSLSWIWWAISMPEKAAKREGREGRGKKGKGRKGWRKHLLSWNKFLATALQLKDEHQRATASAASAAERLSHWWRVGAAAMPLRKLRRCDDDSA